MTIKEFIYSRIQLFFMLTTLILAAEYIMGAAASPEQTLHNKDLLAPIAAAGLCIIPTCVTYFKTEPTLKQYLFRLVIQLILIEGVMLTAVKPDAIDGVSPAQLYPMIAVSTFFIYIIAVFAMYFRNYMQSKALTEELKEFQLSIENT